jgi:hypothetical protein
VNSKALELAVDTLRFRAGLVTESKQAQKRRAMDAQMNGIWQTPIKGLWRRLGE